LVKASPADGEIVQGRERNNVENEQRELEALRFAARAARAIATLESRQKAIVQEISERKKKLRRIIEGVQQREQMGTLALDGLATISISEDDMGLVHDPLRRL
jgi:hypothetical protein